MYAAMLRGQRTHPSPSASFTVLECKMFSTQVCAKVGSCCGSSVRTWGIFTKLAPVRHKKVELRDFRNFSCGKCADD